MFVKLRLEDGKSAAKLNPGSDNSSFQYECSVRFYHHYHIELRTCNQHAHIHTQDKYNLLMVPLSYSSEQC